MDYSKIISKKSWDIGVYPLVENCKEFSIGITYYHNEYLRTGKKKIMFFIRIYNKSFVINLWGKIK